jgi:hypothetical protein
MLDRFDDRTLEITTVVVVVVIALVILCYALIFIRPDIFYNPFPPLTPTPTATSVVALEPTWTPSPTATATGTPQPTATWTPTATPTETPTPTPTSTWTPSPEPTATPTNTPVPTKKPPPPKPPPPTATPTPWPYYYESAGGRPNCDVTMVSGYVRNAAGLPEPDVLLRVGNDQGWRQDITTDINGYYIWHFTGEPIAGKFFVRVFKGGQPRSMQFWFETSAGCESPYSIQEVEIIWRHLP